MGSSSPRRQRAGYAYSAPGYRRWARLPALHSSPFVQLRTCFPGRPCESVAVPTMSPEPKKWIREFDALVGARDGFLIPVRGATSLEPLAERLQPQRRRTEGEGRKRHFVRRHCRKAPTHHV